MTKYRTALVLGLGISGVSAAKMLADEGTRVTAIDKADKPELRERAAALQAAGVRAILGVGDLAAHQVPLDMAYDLCIVSPGIALDSAWALAVKAAGTSLVSEIELAFTRCACPVLAVTGSKGKSTMVKLCAEALEAAGRRVAIAGNYGIPFCDVALVSNALDWVVVEVSSFQLETVRTFRPRVGVLLNIQNDHFDRHGDLQTYAGVKARLYECMQADDTGIVFDVDAPLVQGSARGANRWLTFGLSAHAGFRYADGRVTYPGGTIDVSGTLFGNAILGRTAAAAAAALSACGVDPAVLGPATRAFVPLRHRMQPVAEIGGVSYVNDSKATSLAALAAGVEMCPGPVRLIAGGKIKESDLTIVKDALAKKVREVYLIGYAASLMKEAWSATVPCRMCGDLRTAVGAAAGDAQAGETVLLSPGCASFDQFRDFEDRGDQFIGVVHELRDKRSG